MGLQGAESLKGRASAPPKSAPATEYALLEQNSNTDQLFDFLELIQPILTETKKNNVQNRANWALQRGTIKDQFPNQPYTQKKRGSSTLDGISQVYLKYTRSNQYIQAASFLR